MNDLSLSAEEQGAQQTLWAKALKRHPEFDEYYEQHEGFLWWWAKRLQKRFGGRYTDYTGYLVLRLNMALYGYQEVTAEGKRYKFTTYYSQHLCSGFMRDVLRYESEAWHAFVTNTFADKNSWYCVELSYATLERMPHQRFYRPPEETDDWLQALLALFDTTQQMWDYLTRPLKPRDKFILYAHFRYGYRLHEIGERLRISKQRAQQIEQHALRQVASQCRQLQAFMGLFQLPDTTDVRVPTGDSALVADRVLFFDRHKELSPWDVIAAETGYNYRRGSRKRVS